MYKERKKIRSDSICQKLFTWLWNNIQYFGDQSNLHGVGHACSLTSIPILKRLFWLTFLGLCCFGAASVLRGVLSLYSTDLVSYSVETDYLGWETPFPAVTVCEDKGNLNRIKSWLVSNNMSSNLRTFFKDVFYGDKFCKCDFTSDHLNKKYIEDFHLYTQRIRYNCSQMLTDCWWDGEPFPCCDRFLPLVTEIGVCYSFNSQLTSSDANAITFNRKRTRIPDLIFSALTPEYASLKIHGSDEAISSPTMDDVLGRKNSPLKPEGLNPPVEINISLKVDEQTVSDPSVSTLPEALRGCLYKYEKPEFAYLWPFKVYSLNTCMLYCRAAWQMEHCNCTHHYMPKLEDVPICGISGMQCLYNNKEEYKGVGVDCECPLACEDSTFKVVNVFKTKIDNTQQVTRVRIGFTTLLSMRVKRQALRGMLNLVENEIIITNAQVHHTANSVPFRADDQILPDVQPDRLPENQPELLPDDEPPLAELAVEHPPEAPAVSTSNSEPTEPALDPELLSALGESVDDTPEYGNKIHENLAKIWLSILKKGLTKEKKETVLKEYLTPINCKLLQAPKLNPEISAAVPDMVGNRDKVLMTQQQQLGSGITAINRGMDILLKGDNKKEAIQHLSNGCRILSDLHAFFTQNRIKLLSPSLDKSIIHVIQETERDETLFGQKLSEGIKAAKTIQRQGQQIKKMTTAKTPNTFQQSQRNSHAGNWNAPFRYYANRGSRGGPDEARIRTAAHMRVRVQQRHSRP